MATKSLNTWLGAYVISEAKTLIRWREDTLLHPEIKQEAVDGVYFSNDYSNLRIHHTSTPFEGGKLQIQKILSVGSVVTAYVSDGHTQIKARFFEDAVATLESEMDEKLDESMHGDVFTLKQFNVACTHMGPTDGFVQLEVKQLKYDFHLRRKVGVPAPIEDTPEIQRIIQQIEHFWAKENPIDLPDDDEPIPDADKAITDNDLPASQQAMPDSQVAQASQHLERNTGPVKASVALSPTPSRGSGFGRRGGSHAIGQFGRESNVFHNAADFTLPRQASGLPVTSRPLRQSPQNEHFRTEKTVRLLGLLGQGSKAGAPEPPKPLQASSMEASAAHAPGKQRIALGQDLAPKESSQVTSQRPLPMTQQQYSLHANVATRDPPGSRTTSNAPAQGVRKEGPSRNEETAKRTIEFMPNPPTRTMAMDTHGEQPNPAPSSSTNKPRIPYGRRKIPKDQMKLLEHPSSWYPSLPGNQFPVPNLPVDLLKQFADAQSKSNEPTQEVTPERSKDALQSSHPGTPDTSMLSSSSSDEEIPASQWPPTPSRHRADLPPDSSFPSVAGRDRDADDLEMSAPRPLKIQRLDVQAAESAKKYSASPSQRSVGNKPSTGTHVLTSSPPQLRAQQDLRPSTATPGKPSNYQASPSRPPSATSSIQDPAITHRERRRNWFYFGAQRRQWLEQTYEPDRNGRIHPHTIVALYRLAHKNDQDATLGDFLSIMRQAFPDLRTVTEESSTWPLSLRQSTLPRSSVQDAPSTHPPRAIENIPPATAPMEVGNFHLDDPTPPSKQPMASSSSSLPTANTSESRTHRPNSNLPASSSSLEGAAAAAAAAAADPIPATHSPPLALPSSAPPGLDPGRQPTNIPRDDDAMDIDREESEEREGPEENMGREQTCAEQAEREEGEVPEDWPEPVPIYRQFQEYWHAARPGGAFAAERPPDAETARRPRRRINMLEWDL